MSYFNTTNEEGQTLMDFRKKALSQDDKILEIFEGQQRPMGASEIQDYHPEMILTSVRRSINTLVKNGALECTGEKKKGIYGRKEYTWRLS